MPETTEHGSVLVVEDEAIVALDLVHMLKTNGYEPIHSCATAASAVQLAGEQHPDVVLMDIVLRGTEDGVSAASTILTQYDIPVVFATSHTDAPTLRRALGVSPYGYLVKPLMPDEVHSSIQSAIRRHGVERSVRISEARFRAVFDTSPIAIALYDTDGRLTEANPGSLELFGVPSVENLRGYSIFDDPQISDELKQEVAARKPVAFDIEVDFSRYGGVADIGTTHTGKQQLHVCIDPLVIDESRFAGYVVQIKPV